MFGKQNDSRDTTLAQLANRVIARKEITRGAEQIRARMAAQHGVDEFDVLVFETLNDFVFFLFSFCFIIFVVIVKFLLLYPIFDKTYIHSLIF